MAGASSPSLRPGEERGNTAADSPGPRGELNPTVEIRIHGVGGEAASSLLDDPHPELIAGDSISGFYRPRADKPGLDVDQRRRQALAWGGNTSGSWRNAFWILLLPFALVNVGGFMHRPDDRPSRLLRLFGLSLTLSTVLLSATVAYDVVAIQCGGVPSCVTNVKWLAPFDWRLGGDEVFLDYPARRLALATLAPAGLLTLLWFAGRYAYKDLESYLHKRLVSSGSDDLRLTDGGFWNGYEPAFRARMIHLIAGRALMAATLTWCVAELPDEELWPWTSGLILFSALILVAAAAALISHRVYQRKQDLLLKGTLTRIQVASWLALGAALGLAASWTPWTWLEWLLLPLGVAVLITMLRPLLTHSRRAALLHIVPFLFGLLGGVTLIPDQTGSEPLIGAQGSFFAGLFPAPYRLAWMLAGIQFVLISGLLLKPTRRSLRPDRGEPPGPGWKPEDTVRTPFHGQGSAVLATLSVFIVLAVGAGVHRGVANMVANPNADQQAVQSNSDPTVGTPETGPGTGAPLSNRPPSTSQSATTIAYPWWYETTAHILVVLLLLGAINGWRSRRALNRKPEDRLLQLAQGHLTSDPRGGDEIDRSDPDDLRRLGAVVKDWALSRELARADLKLFWTVLWGFLFALVLFLLQLPATTPALGRWLAWRPPWMGRTFGPAATASLWLVGLLPVLAVTALRLAASNDRWRRQIGRVWDVLMFWPRHVHPFAPPCYAERVVPQLRLHIDRVHERGGKVVVAGHSQGSVIAAAAVSMGPLEHPDADPAKLELVIYGSPIGILYERVFPAYFGPEFYADVAASTRRWHHFFALSDVFAYPLWNDATQADVARPCPACSYDPTGTEPMPLSANRADYVVIDPERWNWPTREPPHPPIRGHGTYATGKHRRFEEHLQKISLS